VKSTDIVASEPAANEALFDAPKDKSYRYPTYFTVPKGVKHL
jgi:1,2-phenylacetyl-CoA epoxidase PaaB subunit